MILAGNNIRSELERMKVKQYMLKLRAERLSALSENREPNFQKLFDEYPELVRKQEEILKAINISNDEEKAVIQKQLQQKIDGRDSLIKSKINLSKTIEIAKETFILESKAYQAGIGSKTTYLQAKSNYINQKGDFERLNSQLIQADQQISEYQSRLKSFTYNSRDKALQELGEVDGLITENEKIIKNLNLRVNQLIIKAPVSGIVKGLEINTIGGVVSPGKKIMEIVPVDQELVAEIKIPPHDVGHVSVGDVVTVKITSYDFSRYGTIQGSVESISASTFQNDRGVTYYKARVKFEKNYVGIDPQKNIILPGMELMGDIITGDKTVMAYLLKPIQISLNGAFSER